MKQNNYHASEHGTVTLKIQDDKNFRESITANQNLRNNRLSDFSFKQDVIRNADSGNSISHRQKFGTVRIKLQRDSNGLILNANKHLYATEDKRKLRLI